RDLRLCYLIRLTNDQLKISQRRGSRSRRAAREEHPRASISDRTTSFCVRSTNFVAAKPIPRQDRRQLRSWSNKAYPTRTTTPAMARSRLPHERKGCPQRLQPRTPLTHFVQPRSPHDRGQLWVKYHEYYSA